MLFRSDRFSDDSSRQRFALLMGEFVVQQRESLGRHCRDITLAARQGGVGEIKNRRQRRQETSFRERVNAAPPLFVGRRRLPGAAFHGETFESVGADRWSEAGSADFSEVELAADEQHRIAERIRVDPLPFGAPPHFVPGVLIL